MKYLEFDNAYGRMSNHFYWLLQAHKYSKIFNETVKIIKNRSYYDFNLEKQYDMFNMQQYAIDRKQIKKDDIIYKNTENPIQRYHQIFRIDFTIEELESFINDTFLNTSIFNDSIKIENQENTIAIHIRNGDYINDKGMDVFDRKKYIFNAINYANKNIENIYVFSDDNTLNEQLYNDILKNRFKTITYIKNTTGIEDFISFSQFKNKILWNSTFSYWAAFIGNVIHKHSYLNVIAPNKFGCSDPIADHVNPLWTILAV